MSRTNETRYIEWHEGFIWNPSNCESECNKAYDVGEYLDHENCKCRKKLVDELVDECTETVEEVKLGRTIGLWLKIMFLALNLVFVKKQIFGKYINGRNKTN